MLAWFDTVIVIARDIGAQGVMVWDIEGQEQPHAASYVCDPTKLDVVAPEMKHARPPPTRCRLADEIFHPGPRRWFKGGAVPAPATLRREWSGQRRLPARSARSGCGDR